MKIVERGIDPREIFYHVRCKNCESVLEFSVSEIKSTSQYNQSYYYIVCPVCNCQINEVKKHMVMK